MNLSALTAPNNILLLLWCALLVGCGTDRPENAGGDGQYTRQAIQRDYQNQTSSESDIATVKVLADGEILLDERKTSVEELRSALVVLRQKSGAVWYYRESTSEESSDAHLAVMDIVTDEGLPTRYSTKSDFSDSVPPFE